MGKCCPQELLSFVFGRIDRGSIVLCADGRAAQQPLANLRMDIRCAVAQDIAMAGGGLVSEYAHRQGIQCIEARQSDLHRFAPQVAKHRSGCGQDIGSVVVEIGQVAQNTQPQAPYRSFELAFVSGY